MVSLEKAISAVNSYIGKSSRIISIRDYNDKYAFFITSSKAEDKKVFCGNQMLCFSKNNSRIYWQEVDESKLWTPLTRK